jgi:hypothetical protein
MVGNLLYSIKEAQESHLEDLYDMLEGCVGVNAGTCLSMQVSC